MNLNEIEFVNFPPKGNLKKLKYLKVVELYIRKNNEEIPTVSFQSTLGKREDCSYHKGILEKVLKDKKLKIAIWLDHISTGMIALAGENYRVAGMGKIPINLKKKLWDYPCFYSKTYFLRSNPCFREIYDKGFKQLGGWTRKPGL